MRLANEVKNALWYFISSFFYQNVHINFYLEALRHSPRIYIMDDGVDILDRTCIYMIVLSNTIKFSKPTISLPNSNMGCILFNEICIVYQNVTLIGHFSLTVKRALYFVVLIFFFWFSWMTHFFWIPIYLNSLKISMSINWILLVYGVYVIAILVLSTFTVNIYFKQCIFFVIFIFIEYHCVISI
jgi:hypothetical protein